LKLLRVKEAAMLLGVKPASIRTLEKRGVIRAVRDWSGHRRFREEEVNAYREKLLNGEIGVPASDG